MKKYVGAKEACKLLNINRARFTLLCRQNRVKGCRKNLLEHWEAPTPIRIIGLQQKANTKARSA